MGTHIKVVALLNIIRGALGVLGGIAVLVGGTFGSLMSGSMIGAIAGTASSVVASVLISALSAVCIAAGFGLLNHKPWARIVIIVLSVLGLFNFMIGTIIAVYTLWVMFNVETVRTFSSPTATV